MRNRQAPEQKNELLVGPQDGSHLSVLGIALKVTAEAFQIWRNR